MSKKAREAAFAPLLRDEEVALRVIRRFSRGNVRMQSGAFLTREQLDARARARSRRIARLKSLYKVCD